MIIIKIDNTINNKWIVNNNNNNDNKNAKEQTLRANWVRKHIDGQKVSENVEYVGKETSKSLTWLQSVKSEPRKITNKDVIIL